MRNLSATPLDISVHKIEYKYRMGYFFELYAFIILTSTILGKAVQSLRPLSVLHECV